MNKASEWAKGMWRPGRDQARASISAWPPSGDIEQRLARLEDEREIERALRRYHSFYDAHEIEGVLDCFTDDAVQINGRGTFVGKESLRASYEWLVAGQKTIIHYATGLLVTLDESDRDVGLLTARFMGFWVPWEGRPNMHGGTYVNRMRRVGGRWLIGEQRITFNYQFDVELSQRSLGAQPPVPDLPVTQFDLLEERYLHA